mgnify:CR=1 FL=1
MNDSIKDIRREVTLEERYTNVSEQLANMSERYDALSSERYQGFSCLFQVA